jgi:hypothetical protein
MHYLKLPGAGKDWLITGYTAFFTFPERRHLVQTDILFVP